MRKIRISELPLYNSLKGLFTIGTDANNRSVKVSLEFVESKTDEAVKNAQTATAAANSAAQTATAAATIANTAAGNATEKASNAQAATDEAITAANIATEKATEAQNAATNADNSAKSATDAATAAEESTEAAQTATDETQAATQKAQVAAEAANTATQNVLDVIGSLVPTALSVDVLKRLTYGNLNEINIKAILTPNNAMNNIIYLSDNKAIEVDTNGRITIVAKGKSRVHIIPTLNTAIAKTVLIEVCDPTVRMVTHSKFRLTQSGTIRLN